MKLVTSPPIAPKIRSSVIAQTPKNTISVGTDMIIAINEPLAIISLVVIFFAEFSVIVSDTILPIKIKDALYLVKLVFVY